MDRQIDINYCLYKQNMFKWIHLFYDNSVGPANSEIHDLWLRTSFVAPIFSYGLRLSAERYPSQAILALTKVTANNQLFVLLNLRRICL